MFVGSQMKSFLDVYDGHVGDVNEQYDNDDDDDDDDANPVIAMR